MDISRIKVNKVRLRKDLEALGKFGEEPDGGILRPALSEADLKAREWFKGRMRDAGLQVREDAVANIIGRLEPASGAEGGPCIATGSHTDAVLHGGKFDGAAGLCCSLEALRAIQESGIPVPCPLELMVFTDEEGGHYAGTFGSRAMFNLLVEGEIYKSRGAGRPFLAQSLERMGKDPAQSGKAVRSPSEFRAFLELHIEQGPVLDSLGIPIGVVEGIVAIDRHMIEVEGKAGHAGTTPMRLRDDALVKAARIVTAVNRAVRSLGADIVGTIGEMKVHPGAFNIIPGRVEMTLDLRSMKKSILKTARGKIREILRSTRGASLATALSKDRARKDRKIMEFIEESCRQRGVSWKRMGSGAGHDAMTFPTQGIPTGMIFIPCKEGKSHCPEEAIRWEDAAIGAQILADTIMRIGFNIGTKSTSGKVRAH
ncbi:MAG: Zn-dependent hydrolase [Deltaproteobacteria bacterium]|nr:Zn-dependent hydrolase [Deltaproteobacteria bacterium]